MDAPLSEFTYYQAEGRWRWRHVESGRTGWHLNGGSDTMAAGDPVAAEPTEPSEPTAEPAAPAEGADDGDWGYDRMEHADLTKAAKKLRAENIKTRAKLKELDSSTAPLRQAFDGAAPEDTQGYLNFVALLRSGDPEKVQAAAAWMRENLDRMSPAQAAAVQEAADDASEAAGGDDDFDPFDQEAIAKLVEERATKLLDDREAAQQAKAEESRVIGEMNDYAAGLAKTHKLPFDDQDAPEYLLLWKYANQEPPGSYKDRLSAAAEKVVAWRADSAKQYLKAKSADAETPASPPEGGAPSGEQKPRTLKDASRSAAERVAKMGAAPGTP